MRFERLARGHTVAAVAALILLLVMAMTWYGSTQADFARQVENQTNTSGAAAGEIARTIKATADQEIARDEKNAWQEPRTIDRVLLVLLLVTIFLALFTAAHRAAGRRAQPPWTPTAFTAIAAASAALLIAYRIVNEPGNDAKTTVKLGAPLGLVMCAIVGLGAVAAFQGEARWSEMRRSAMQPAGGRAEAASQPEGGSPEPASQPYDQAPDAGDTSETD